MTEAKVHIGVIGVGTMGAAHARDLLAGKVPHAILTAVADPDTSAREGIVSFARADKSADIASFPTARELLGSGLVDAVLVATPHPDHPTCTIAALDAGLHVLVEKPLASHKADCERMIAAYERRPRREQQFAEMFNQRTDPRYLKVRELVGAGELGEIRRVSWTATDWFRTDAYYGSGGWRATWRGEGGGVLLNQAPHHLDLLIWLFGMPRRVRAFCGFGRFHAIEVEDDVTAYLELDKGATCVFTTSTGEAPGENRLVVAGDRGKLVVEPDKILFAQNEVPAGEFKRTSPERFAAPPVRHTEMRFSGSGPQHLGILGNFVAAILRGEPLIAPAVEGIKSVELANAMIRSAMLEHTVELPIDSIAYAALLEELMAGSKVRFAAGGNHF
jgi:predicted dehydrogenase